MMDPRDCRDYNEYPCIICKCKKEKKNRCCIDLIIFVLSILLAFTLGLLIALIPAVAAILLAAIPAIIILAIVLIIGIIVRALERKCNKCNKCD